MKNKFEAMEQDETAFNRKAEKTNYKYADQPILPKQKESV
jgi:hypothetical protein